MSSSSAPKGSLVKPDDAAPGTNPMMQTFAFTVPAGVGPGQQFQASLDGQLTMVIVPDGSGPSSTLHVQIPTMHVRKYAVTVPHCIQPGGRFLADLGGQLLWLTCPRNLGPGKQMLVDASAPSGNGGSAKSWPPPIGVPESTEACSCTAEREERTEEVEEAEEKTCRLCWGGEDDGPLLQPCACRGSAKWIHEHCLEQWRRTGPREDAAYRCGQCRDEYRDALSLELLSARLQAERKDGEDTSFTWIRLALELRAQGKYDEAEPLFCEALEVRRETLGDRHPSTLSCISNLGGLLYAKGDHAAAEPLYREALEVRRETLGSRHPDTLVSISNLGALLKEKGDLAGAEPLCREALEVKRETLGSRHPSTLMSISHLGLLLKAKGDNAAAEPLYREALEGLRETLGIRHPDTLISYNNLGVLLQAKGDLAAAEPLYREALEVQRETLGSRHPHTLMSIKNLGLLLKAKSDLASTEPQLRKAAEGRLDIGCGHPNMLYSIIRSTTSAFLGWLVALLSYILQKMGHVAVIEG